MKPFTKLAAVLFALMAIVHLLRIFFGWRVTFDGLDVPIWVSSPAAVILLGLAWMLWREARK